ncbi:MAG: 3-phosphoshikimate 1-carboxyvinyltransferase [Candidatus Omnitrophota bacterium]
MMQIKIKKINRISGEFTVPADKSVSQRAIILSAVATGTTIIDNFLKSDDTQRTIAAFQAMKIPIKIKRINNRIRVTVKGKGLTGLKVPATDLFMGNSGTTMRLITGMLAAQNFKTKLTGDYSLSRRPMQRIVNPLKKMGANIQGKFKFGQIYPPLVIQGKKLKAINYRLPVKSAQVKSSILLAGLYANGKTAVKEILKTRDHTERMLKLFKAEILIQGLKIKISGGRELISPKKMFIPGDLSSAAFFMVAAAIIPGSKLIIRDVGLNPTRIGVIKLLKKMGANIKIIKKNAHLKAYEPYADIIIKSSNLKGITIREKEVAFCIDELPIICVAACLATGRTKILRADELRIKETDRIFSMVSNLKKMGADIRNQGNDLIIKGKSELTGAIVDSFGDHRTAMCMAIAGLKASGETIIKNTDCINKSFPNFLEILRLIQN